MEPESPATSDVAAREDNGQPSPQLSLPPPMEQLEVLVEPHALNGAGGDATPDQLLSGGSVFDSQEMFDFNEIQIKEKVGHGSYGTVFKAVLRDRVVAVKEFESSAEPKAIETEVKQLSRVSHPNIIALYGISATVRSMYLIMEFAEGGSLHNFLHGTVKPVYTTAHAISWARQCAEGVAYLHAMKPKPLIHRDLKPLNLLLSNQGRILKICDFGTVVDKKTNMTNNRGSAAWMAPEVFAGQQYTEKCDIFSWGIVLWEMLTRQQPFKDVDNTYSIMWRIHQGHRPPPITDCPDAIQSLMNSCWSNQPELRPPMSQVVEVMNQLATNFPGHDEPLEYEFVNLQIRCSNRSDSEQSNYAMDFSSFNSSANNTTLTHINSWNESLSTSETTPTNEVTPLPDSAQRRIVPPLSLNYDVIPEESSEVSTATANSESALNTNDEIDFTTNDSSSGLAKSDGKSLLTVTDTKTCGGCGLLPNHTLATGGGTERFTMNPPFGSGVAGDSCGDSDTIDDDDNEDQSLHEMLDNDLQPEPPIPGNSESEQIYQEHRRLAKQYLQVETKLYYTQDCKKKLLEEMDPAERRKKEELLDKMRNKEELLELYKSLKSQLEMMQEPQPLLPRPNIPRSECSEDDWVLVNTNSHSNA